MKNYEAKLIEIFYHVDDFNQVFVKELQTHQLTTGFRRRVKPSSMSESELMNIIIFFHLMRYRNFKHYYLFHVCKHMNNEFPHLLSYNRFVEFSHIFIIPLVIFLKTQYLGKYTGISFIDSTSIRACHLKREHFHKVLKGLATKGHCSIGWFFGLKMHFIINDMGDILDFVPTLGNFNVKDSFSRTNLLVNIYGKLFRDKGYISQSLFEKLFIYGLYLITKMRKNLKNSLMHIYDKNILRKRKLVETVCDELKNICQIEHMRYRSQEGFIVNLISELIAYCYLSKKPSLNLGIIDQSMVSAYYYYVELMLI